MTQKPRIAVRPTDLSLLSEELKAIPHWDVWRLELVGDVWAKVPYNARGGGKAQSNNPATWNTFQRALRAYKAGGYDGINLALREGSGLVGVDLDHCGDIHTGRVEDWAFEIVHTVNSYTEWTPSGRGLRIFCRGTLPPEGRKRGDVEMYSSARFMTVTGRHLVGTPLTVEECSAGLARMHAKYLARPEQPVSTSRGRSYLTDAEVMERALKASNGGKFGRLYSGDWGDYASRSEADLALAGMLAFWCGGDPSQIDRLMRGSGLCRPAKWDASHRADGRTYGEMTVERACNRGEFYEPDRLLNTAPRGRRVYAAS
jgi:putative DNA primase/helicase